MKKRLLTLLVALSAIVLCQAEVVTPEQALAVARGFVNQGGHSLKAGVTLKLAHQARSVDGKPDYYVFNNGDDGGFIVVSGDDRTVPVWGYSTSGTFDYESMPDNAKWWYSEYQRELQYLRDHPEVKARKPVKLTTSVAPLLTTKWGQGSPYNYYCPTAYDEKAYISSVVYENRACTGCVATVLAQIMNYHQWPKSGVGSESYDASIKGFKEPGSSERADRTEKLSANFNYMIPDWSLMKNKYGIYDKDDGTIAYKILNDDGYWVECGRNDNAFQMIQSVATLIKNVGYAVNMNYGSYSISSTSSPARAKNAMENYFQYSATIMTRSETPYVDGGEWDNNIRNEIDANRPIYYGGASPAGGGNDAAGHAFIVDGYNQEGYFHVNWGWDGNNDEYYLSTLLNPGSYNFETNHIALFLKPLKGQDSEQPVKSLKITMPKSNAKTLKGSKAYMHMYIFCENLDENVSLTLSGQDADQFSLTYKSLEPQEKIEFYVKYMPSEVGRHYATLTVSADNDVDPVSINLSGEAVLNYDANGDVHLDVADVVAYIDATLNNTSLACTDNPVDVSDVVRVIDAVLNGTGTVDIGDGLVAYYPFNGDASDASGNGNHGEAHDLWGTHGVIGDTNGAWHFGGTNHPGYIRVPKSESLQFTDGFTFACYVKPLEWSGTQCIFAKDNDSRGPNLTMHADDDMNMTVNMAIPGEQWASLSSNGKIDGNKLNEWVHVAVTYSKNKACMYIDGRLAETRSITADFTKMNSYDLYLGRCSNNRYPLDGVMDEVRIYNRALNACEVLELASDNPVTNEERHPFKLSQNKVKLAVGESITLDILNGNGSYSVGSDPDVVDFTLDIASETITLKGMGVGTTNVTVIDVNTQTTIMLPITVTKPKHEWVDLGLPSGTLWATCNVGANSPEEYGDYFAWGETEEKDVYNWSTYKWCNGSYSTLTKYCTNSSYGYNGFVDNKTELDPEDDAAYVNWGPSWRIPTTEQQRELYEKCSSVWTTQNGVNGRLFTGPNGNTLFLPAAGDRWGESLGDVGSYGYYWSRTLYSYDPYVAYDLYVDSGCVLWGNYSRYNGFTVRAVRVSQN